MVSLNHMKKLMKRNIRCHCLKLASLAYGWETAVDSYVQKYWGISRPETMVRETRKGFC